MKIAVIAPHYHYLKRGAEKVVQKISELLTERGHTIDIYSIGIKEHCVKGIQINKGAGKIFERIIDSSQFGGFSRKYIGIEPSISHLSYFISMSNIFDPTGYDILWNNGEMIGALFCSKIRRMHKIPFISTFHGNESMMMVSEGWLKPDGYILLTPQHEEFLKRFNIKNIKVIPNGVDLDRFNPKITELSKYGIPELEHPRFLSTSALVSGKRVEMIVEAVSRLKKGSLIISSTGADRKKVLDICERKLKNRYTYVGVVPDKEMAGLYASCDVYVNASRSEGHCLAILEALATNKPVVTHDDTNRRWTIGDAGIVVNVVNSNLFANALEKTVTSEWMNKPRGQAEKFSWEITTKKYEKEMECLLKRTKLAK